MAIEAALLNDGDLEDADRLFVSLLDCVGMNDPEFDLSLSILFLLFASCFFYILFFKLVHMII